MKPIRRFLIGCALLVFLVCGCAEVPPLPLNHNQGRNEDLATAILGKWKYLPAISKRRPCDGVWCYLKFRENGTVDYSYNYDGKTYTCTDAYKIQYSGKIDKLRSKYPIIHMWSTKPMASRGSELIGVTGLTPKNSVSLGLRTLAGGRCAER